MPANKYHILLILLLACGSCIDPFEPEIDEIQEQIVINGFISDIPGRHYVEVSRSTPYNDPGFVPVEGCFVSVADGNGDRQDYWEEKPGIYSADLPGSFLEVGEVYSVFVFTPDGLSYRSDYDTLLACPPVDSVYFEVETRGTPNPDDTLHGVQFFADVAGIEGQARNFRWLLEETWVYRTANVGDHVLYGEGERIEQWGSDPIHQCYKTQTIKELQSGSTRHLAINRLRRTPLTYVSNETPRIKIRYSLLVRQHSLTNDAFRYWDKMESQASESGGLYETQPSSAEGNIYNTNDADTRVLGYFYATQERSRRITFENDFDFDVPGFKCQLDTAYIPRDFGKDFPYYMFSLNPMGTGYPYAFGDQMCFDCRRKGGVLEKPDFW